MRTHWTSKKPTSIVNELRERLDLYFNFANADLGVSESDHVKNCMYGFLDSMMAGQPAIYPLEVGSEKDEMIQLLQKHLRARLKKIIHKTKFLVEMPLWSINGSLEFTIEAKTNRFHERFRFRRLRTDNELKALIRMVDLALIEIIRDLNFKPNRFRQCPRCKTLFYQPTEKAKAYCSIRCGDAVRLQKHRRERRKKERQDY